MKADNVPQDAGKLDGEKELCYAVDAEGNYTTVQSAGWQAKNITLDQAWTYINEQVQSALTKIKAGEQSNLAYFMALNQMDLKLLSDYSNYSRRQIKKHLKPKNFKTLSSDVLQNYAHIFRISVQDLTADLTREVHGR